MGTLKPHIVAVPLMAVGHITPMMHLCSCLSKHGCSITFVILSSEILHMKELIEQRGTWPPPGSDITLVELRKTLPVPDGIVNRQVNLTYAHTRARAFAGELKELVRDLEGVSAIVSDYQFSWATEVAVKLQIPAAILFTGSSTWSWFDFNMVSLVSENLVPDKEEILSEDEDTLLCQFPLLRRSDIPWHFWNAVDFQDFTIRYNVPLWEKAQWVFFNTCEPLEQEMLQVMAQKLGPDKCLAVGPLFLANEERECVGLERFNRDALNWLDEQEKSSVLYIAFGSLASLALEQREEFARGLKASKQKFLWVVRSSIFGDECYKLYREILQGAEGMLIPWAPQVEVLSHAAVGAFLTHCGWNSTLEGVTTGQPMICWPCLFDQNINARLIVQVWKIGVGMTKKGGTDVVDRKEVERVIRLVMEDDEGKVFRASAKELSAQIQKSVESSRAKLKAYVEELKTAGGG